MIPKSRCECPAVTFPCPAFQSAILCHTAQAAQKHKPSFWTSAHAQALSLFLSLSDSISYGDHPPETINENVNETLIITDGALLKHTLVTNIQWYCIKFDKKNRNLTWTERCPSYLQMTQYQDRQTLP